MANALNSLHENGIYHGDTTPDNIGYRTADDNYVLFDFGASNFSGNLNMYRTDVTRFLNSMLRTYITFFQPYRDKIMNILNQINQEYYIGKFDIVIEENF